MILKGKKGLITGVANQRSIAWGIARSCWEQGAELCFSYPSERLKGSVESLIQGEGKTAPLFECDVTRDDSIAALFAAVEKEVGKIDFLVHAIAYAKREDLDGEFQDTSRDGFVTALDISAYSLTALAHHAVAAMNPNGSIVSLSYIGGEKVIPHYNVMGVAKAALECSAKYLAHDLGKQGIRVNIVSAGPIRTLAAKGIGDFNKMLSIAENRSALHRNVDTSEVGDTAAFLVSDMARGITGELVHVDAGYHAISFSFAEEQAQNKG
ncbi:MAG TPA: enoyl-ACP reductase [Fibrobacteria bacterium]|nr:enoyl-ACP reductase [Fibrobacteria bacterium]